MPDTISATGVVGTTPSLTVGNNGIPRLTFRLASGQRRYNRETGSWENGDTNWYTVVAFRRLAENAERSLAKGERVVVTGRLRVNEWEKEGTRSISVDLIAEGIGHDLAFGTSTYTKSAWSAAVPSTSGAPEGSVADQADAVQTADDSRPAPPAVDADGWALPGARAGDESGALNGAATTQGQTSHGVDPGETADGDRAEPMQLEFATAEPPF
jgi:single-strand DNA-binding protein